ncbi:hypothetical protein DL93DRAFT_2196365 [Clavulina sp. PMI_390]|nr:hypothetical protein DL93DRAFT_2196365 [Clavulina sp. PMI_390]
MATPEPSHLETPNDGPSGGDRSLADIHVTSAESPATPSLPSAAIGAPESARGEDSIHPDLEIPFDFQMFLEQIKSRSAEPVAKYLRSFLSNFTKKSLPVNDQVKVIRDFLDFIGARMSECDVWKHMSAPEFDNACEAMEKLVMNRLYDYTFTPQIASSGRLVTTDDLERDGVLRQRISLFSWVRPEHLDISSSEGSQGFTTLAQAEVLKINQYKAPRDKLICVLNCCKVIFGLLRHLREGEGADAFVPLLIYVLLKANPPHLLSNVEYINRFRHPSRLQSESGYYFSSLMAAISFIETMDHSSLSNITQSEFESNVEAAIQNLPPASNDTISHRTSGIPNSASDESAGSLMMDPGGDTSFVDDTRRFFQKTGETISKPMSMIGKIVAEALEGLDSNVASRSTSPLPSSPPPPIPTSYKPRTRPSPSPSRGASSTALAAEHYYPGRVTNTRSEPPREGALTSNRTPASIPHRESGSAGGGPSNDDFTAAQQEIDRIHDAASHAARETLKKIFPNVEDEVASMILEANHGDVGRAIDQLLDITS